MKKNEFIELCDKFRPDHLWEKRSNRWALKKLVIKLATFFTCIKELFLD